MRKEWQKLAEIFAGKIFGKHSLVKNSPTGRSKIQNGVLLMSRESFTFFLSRSLSILQAEKCLGMKSAGLRGTADVSMKLYAATLH